MKKILSSALVGVMALSMIPTALATTDYSNGTEVKYEGQGAAQYTITVPALLAPEGSGTVTLSGTWASDCKVKVTADASVELTNSINTNDKKTLTVSFAGIEKSGDNTAVVTATEAVSVGAIDNALFGTWSGKFNYNVEYVEPAAVEMISFSIDGMAFQVKKGTTWMDWLTSDSNTYGFITNAGGIILANGWDGKEWDTLHYQDTNPVLATDEITNHKYYFSAELPE